MIVHGTSICMKKMFQGRRNSGFADGSSKWVEGKENLQKTKNITTLCLYLFNPWNIFSVCINTTKQAKSLACVHTTVYSRHFCAVLWNVCKKYYLALVADRRLVCQNSSLNWFIYRCATNLFYACCYRPLPAMVNQPYALVFALFRIAYPCLQITQYICGV